MKKILIALVMLAGMSCIPLKVAPTIKDYEIMVARKFKKDLPKQYAFVFEDRNGAIGFYQFAYWQLGRINVDLTENLPLEVNGSTYYLTFYERPKKQVYLNLFPFALDAAWTSQGGDSIIEDFEIIPEDEFWYILITVIDSDYRDCLESSYPEQKSVIEVLKQLKDEYDNFEHTEEQLAHIQ